MAVVVNSDDQNTVNEIWNDLIDAMFDLSKLKVADPGGETAKADVLTKLVRVSEKLGVLGIKYGHRQSLDALQAASTPQKGC